MLNIDGDVRPGRYLGLYTTLAEACLEFEEQREKGEDE